jgi:hypothetical protein
MRIIRMHMHRLSLADTRMRGYQEQAWSLFNCWCEIAFQLLVRKSRHVHAHCASRAASHTFQANFSQAVCTSTSERQSARLGLL